MARMQNWYGEVAGVPEFLSSCEKGQGSIVEYIDGGNGRQPKMPLL